MKKLLTAIFLLIQIAPFCQEKSLIIQNSIEAHFIDFKYSGTRICIADKFENEIKVLSDDNKVLKTIKIPVNKGYEMPIVSCLSDNLFNSDTLVEFICQYNRNSDPNAENGKIVIYNEKGEKLLETIGYQYEVGKINNVYKLLISDMYIKQEVKIYDLVGVFVKNVFWGTYRFKR